MTRLALLGATLLVLVLSASATAGASFPSEGLMFARPHVVVVVDLRGRVVAKLIGYRLAPESGDPLVDPMVQQEVGGTYLTPALPVLVGPGKSVWELSGRRLARLRRGLIPLPGGADIVGRVAGKRSDGSPIVSVTVRDAKTHRLLEPASATSWFVAGHLLVDPSFVTDLVTRRQWRLPVGVIWAQGVGADTCNPAGIVGDAVVAVCAIVRKNGAAVVRAFAVQHDGRRVPVSGPFRYANFGAETALLSPDGKHVAATLAVGCGLSPSIVAGTNGGAPHDLGQSYALGWSGAGRIVAEFAHGECTKTSPPEVDLVDPTTFARSTVYVLPKDTQGFAFWSSDTA